MLDTVLLDNGKAYKIKAPTSIPATWDSFRSQLIAGTALLDIILNTDVGDNQGVDIVGTPLNVATLLTPAVAAALGVSATDPTVNDAFATLAAAFTKRADFSKSLALIIADALEDSTSPDFVLNRILDRLGTGDHVSGDWTYSSGQITVSSGTGAYYFDVYTAIPAYSYTEGAWTSNSSGSAGNPASHTITGSTAYSFDAATGTYSLTGTATTYTLNWDSEYTGVYNLYGLADGGRTLVLYKLWNEADTEVRWSVESKGSTSALDSYTKGTYLYTIEGGGSDYPADGEQGGKWYVKGDAVGTTDTATATLGSWALDADCNRVLAYFKATTTGICSLTYQASLDNGTTWYEIENAKIADCSPGSTLKLRAIASFRQERHDPATDLVGYIVSNTDGSVSTDPNYTTSDLIPVYSNSVTFSTTGSTTQNWRWRCALYDSNGDFISCPVNAASTNPNRSTTVNTTGAAYVRIMFLTGITASLLDAGSGSATISGYGAACLEAE